MNFYNIHILRILGILVFINYIWLRFIRKRLPRELYIYDSEGFFDYFLLFFLCFFLIISILGFITYFKLVTNKPINVPNLKIIYYFMKFVIYLKEAVLSLIALLAKLIPNSYEKLKYLVLTFYRYFGHCELIIILLFNIIPYTLVTLVFCYDIFINFKLVYFYKILLILIMPLIYNIWTYLIEDIANNLIYLKEYLIIKHKFLPDGKDHFTFKPNPKIDKEEIKLNINEYVNEYLLLYPLKGFLQSLEYYENYYKYRILFLMYTCYLIGWVFMIIKNIYLFV